MPPRPERTAFLKPVTFLKPTTGHTLKKILKKCFDFIVTLTFIIYLYSYAERFAVHSAGIFAVRRKIIKRKMGGTIMKNLNVSMKLVTGFLIITAFSILLVCVGIYSAGKINDNYVYLIDGPITRQSYLQKMQADFTMMRYRAANYVMNSGDVKFINEKLLPQYKDAYESFQSDFSELMDNSSNDKHQDPEIVRTNNEKALSMKEKFEQYHKTVEKTLSYSLAGDMKAADAMLKDVIPLTGEINTAIAEMIVPTGNIIEEIKADNGQYTVRTVFIQICMTFVCLLTAMILALGISRLISKPVTILKRFLDKAGTKGNLTLTPEEENRIQKYAKNKDEIGQCINSATVFIQHLKEINDNLAKIANGDLTGDIELLSDEDTMGKSMIQMVNQLNSMFAEIQTSASQVSAGSKQVANGAQTLAQGSNQQAASISELSTAISDIADKTKTNAQTAGKTAKLSASIKENAEKGTCRMSEMITAVKDINNASQSISKIIKTIDDIAFQTNILALNAAVEAARAGQHGKGFAVVAEEVRNLAAKSAAAAKDTGNMIQNSMEKAEFGSRIAGDTAASLTEIVTGINESSRLIAEIAKSSEEQSTGISNINTGIDQVAQVVAQNNSTAHESAASSEQMSCQSDVLQQLISQFKLKCGRI